MKKIIVPVISVAFYLAIYAAVALLKPPQHDLLGQTHHLTYPLLQSIDKQLHIEKFSS